MCFSYKEQSVNAVAVYCENHAEYECNLRARCRAFIVKTGCTYDHFWASKCWGI